MDVWKWCVTIAAATLGISVLFTLFLFCAFLVVIFVI